MLWSCLSMMFVSLLGFIMFFVIFGAIQAHPIGFFIYSLLIIGLFGLLNKYFFKDEGCGTLFWLLLIDLALILIITLIALI